MKKVLKFLGIFVLAVIILLYIYFLIFLPKTVNLELYKNDIQKIVKENTGFNLDYENARVITTPFLEGGVYIDNLTVKYDDGSNLFNAPVVTGKISLLHLLLLDVRLSDILVCKPVVNFEITNGKEFRAIKTIEKILYENEKKQSLETISKKEDFSLLSLIRINVPSVKILDSRVYISDDMTKEYLLLTGDETKIAYLNGKRAKVKTNSKLYLNKDKQIDLDININSFIPKSGELDEEDDPSVRTEALFINPVKTYKNYCPKGNLIAKIKLDENKIKGFFNIEDLTLDINGYKIPKSYIKTEFKNNGIIADADLYISNNQNLKFSGNFKNSSSPNFELKLFSNGVYFNNLISLLKAATESLGIKTNLDYIKGKGYFTADAEFKTNSKSFKSNGKIEIKDGALINTKENLGINNFNASFIFDNDNLKISDTKLNINDGVFKIEGLIDKEADTDVTITGDNIPLPVVFKTFAPSDIKKEINFNNGNLSFNTKIKGRIKNPVYFFEGAISNFRLSDKLNTLILLNKDLKLSFNNSKKLSGKIQNEDFSFLMPYNNASIKNNLFEINFDDRNIDLNPFILQINKNSTITAKGAIKDYLKNPEIDFNLDGHLYSNELKTFLGASAAPFIDAKGVIPVKLNLSGNSKKQTLRAQIAADNKNYITPVHIKNVLNNQTITQLLIDFKGNRIKIKNTGLYSKIVPSVFDNDFDINIADTNKVAVIDGTIADTNSPNPVINMLKFSLNKPLEMAFAGFKDSYMKLNGKLSIFGKINLPRTKGKIVIENLFIPDAALKMNEAKLVLNGHEGEISTEGLTVSNSDLEFSSRINLGYLPVLYFNNAIFKSNSIDLDKLLTAANNVMLMIPEEPVKRPPSDIPAVINSGIFDIKNLKTGEIKPKNTTGNFYLNNNIFSVNNLSTTVFKGNVTGVANVNLLSNAVDVNVKGKSMDSDEALIVLANMKDTIKGELSFDTNVSLKGLTFEEQVKTLDGVFNFSIKDGQAGPFSKIENIFLSENLRESEFFKTAIGSAVSSAVSIDTSRFDELKGSIKFNGTGIADIDPVTMTGSALCIKIGGNMDILANTLDVHVRGRLGSMVSSVLGPLANINPINIVKATPGLNVVMAKTFSMFCEQISKEEMDLIPDFSKERSDFNATKFQLILKGDAAKPLTLLKSFKWLVTEEEYENAEQFVSSIPDEMPEGITTLSELQLYREEQARMEAENKTLKGKLKNIFKKKEKV